MNSEDWYRHTAWTAADREDFYVHLKRARSSNRGRYLRAQATILAGTGSRAGQEGALELLDHLLDEYAGPADFEAGYLLKARCLESLGRLDEAVDAYRLAFQARRINPTIRTYAPLEFGMFAIRQDRADLYPEVQSIHTEFLEANDLVFPDAKYMYFAAHAIMADRLGHPEVARRCARMALEAASMDRSGSARHPGVGLVEQRDPSMERKLTRILRPGPPPWLKI
jgi:tetratricopeptide (TPR) repeat protein